MLIVIFVCLFVTMVTSIPTPEPQWTEWGLWNECSQKCEPGIQVRRRHCPGLFVYLFVVCVLPWQPAIWPVTFKPWMT